MSFLIRNSLYIIIMSDHVSQVLSVCMFVLDIRLIVLYDFSGTTVSEAISSTWWRERYYCIHPVCHPGMVGIFGRGGPPAPGTAGGQIAAYTGYLRAYFNVQLMTIYAVVKWQLCSCSSGVPIHVYKVRKHPLSKF